MKQSQPPEPLSWKDIIARRKSHVVLIEHAEGLGTGLLITENGLIVTNKHVVEGSEHVRISFANNTTTKGVVLHVHLSEDLAMIKAAVHGAACLNIDADSSTTAEEGDEVIAIGHPHGLRFTSTRGIVSVARQRVGKGYFIQHDVAINPGNSGGPLIDRAGRLVGINTLGIPTSQGIGFAIPAAVVAQYVADVAGAIAGGKTKVPTDEEVLDAGAEVTPEAAVHAAVMSFEGKKEERRTGSYILTTSDGYVLAVWISDDTFECVCWIADLNDSALEDDRLLRRLLEINHSTVQTKFCIDTESKLWVAARRFTAGLDVVEAYSIIASVVSTTKKYEDVLQQYLIDNHTSNE